jgi:hypothetical protein
MFYLYEINRVAARSYALDCTALNREVCDRSRITALGIPRCRHEAMVARAMRETRSMWSALDHCLCARSHRRSIVASRVRAQACSACAIVVVLDRRWSAIEHTNRGFTHLSSILPFKPRLHNNDLQHKQNTKIN